MSVYIRWRGSALFVMTKPTRVALISALLIGALASGANASPMAGLAIPVSDPGATAGLKTAKSAGVKFVRLGIEWADLEPSEQGQYAPGYLAQLDRDVHQAGQRGLKVLLTAVGSPCWASSAPASLRRGCTGRVTTAAVAAYPPSNPRTFASVAAFLARRYAPSLAGFEVWNEPDQINQLYFAGPNKTTGYAALLRATYPAIKAAAPKVPVLGGALVGGNGRFLQALYHAGIKGYYDALSLHFYGAPLYSLRQTRAVQLANGDHTPVWLAEFGWSSCAPHKTEDQLTCVTPKIQGQNLADVFNALRHTSWVKAALVYAANDDATSHLGLTTTTFKPKPALAALRRAIAHPRPPRVVKLAIVRFGGSANPRVAVTGSGPAGDVWTLSVYNGQTLRFRAVFPLNASDRFRFRLPADIGPADRLRAVIKSSWSPGHVTRARLKLLP